MANGKHQRNWSLGDRVRIKSTSENAGHEFYPIAISEDGIVFGHGLPRFVMADEIELVYHCEAR